MQKSNNSKFILLTALFVFASTKKVYAESENSNENSLILHTEEQISPQELIQNEPQQQENEIQGVQEDNEISNSETVNEISSTVNGLTEEEQEQIFTELVNSLSPEEQEQFIELLEEAALITENSQTQLEPKEMEKTFLEKFSTARCAGFCVKVALAFLFWELVQPHPLVEKNPWLPKACPEFVKVLIGVLFVDDIKDFIKEFKKCTESECKMLYKTYFSSQSTCA